MKIKHKYRVRRHRFPKAQPLEWEVVDDPFNEWGFNAPAAPFRTSITYEELVSKKNGVKGELLQTRQHHFQGRISQWKFYSSGWVDEVITAAVAKVKCPCECSGCLEHHRYENPRGYKEGIWVDGAWYPLDDPIVYVYSYK